MLGIFDSGIGGLTVARAIREQAPNVDIVYFGDVANVPYGNRSIEELELLTFRSMKFLRTHGATHLVSACNSISTTVIRSLIDTLGAKEISLTEMVMPTVRALMPEHEKIISIIATQATVQSGLYKKDFADCGINTHTFSMPELASLIEINVEENEIRKIIQTIIPKLEEVETDILVLGCTHYPFVKDIFTQELKHTKKPITIFDPSYVVASEALIRHGVQGAGITTVYTSKKSESFIAHAQDVFGKDVDIFKT